MDSNEFLHNHLNIKVDENDLTKSKSTIIDELHQTTKINTIKSANISSQEYSNMDHDSNDANTLKSNNLNESTKESVRTNSESSEWIRGSTNQDLSEKSKVITEEIINNKFQNDKHEYLDLKDRYMEEHERDLVKEDDNVSKELIENQEKDKTKEIEPQNEMIIKAEENDKFFCGDIGEKSGFPKCFEGWVICGKTIPINKKTFNSIEVDGNDSIIDCVSQVVPILLKKPNIFPPKYENCNSAQKSDKEKENEESKDKEIIKKDEEFKKDESSQNELVEKDVKKDDKIKQNSDSTLMISDYFNSSVGNFLMNIGLSRCKEAFHKDGMRQAQKLIRKEGERAEYVDELNKQTRLYHEYKRANSIYTFDQLCCTMCDFKSESEVVMEGHYLTPHLSNKKEYKCNFCVFVTRDARVIQYHFQSEHKKHPTIQNPPHLYECPTCNYESNQKSKAANHVIKCAKLTEDDKIHETVMQEYEYPAITPRPISQDDLRLYDSTTQALRSIVINPSLPFPNIPGLPKALQQQIVFLLQQQYNQQKMKLNKTIQTKLTNQHNNALKQLQQQQNSIMSNLLLNNSLNQNALALNNSNLLNNLTSNLSNLNNLNNLNSFAKASPHLYKMLQSGSQTFNKNASNNSIVSINMHSNLKVRSPAQQSAQLSKSNIKGLLLNNTKPSSSKDLNTHPGTDKTFVICEICDGYIKDLEELRTHMSRQHKVKIHPKMIASRPPLNCQKCQWRFFTDQGLERHLLGGHGLVTSNMQDLVDQDQDGGRCTICGKIFTNKLVTHMSQIHKKTLRPAHLSYKCTVCSATFNLYRLFENHVYMVHSNVKRSNDNEANSIAKKMKPMDLKINSI